MQYPKQDLVAGSCLVSARKLLKDQSSISQTLRVQRAELPCWEAGPLQGSALGSRESQEDYDPDNNVVVLVWLLADGRAGRG